MEVKIIDTAYGGYGIAKDNEGKVIFVPHCVENDILDIDIIKESKKFSYASINKIIEPSEYRINPKCKYAGICGGCVFNHIDYKKQLDIKKNIVLNAVRNIEYNNDIKIIYNNNSNYRLRVNMVAVNGKIGFYKFKTIISIYNTITHFRVQDKRLPYLSVSFIHFIYPAVSSAISR